MSMPEHRSFVGPVILIGLGLIFLLNNLGMTDLNIWDLVVRFWPVILIVVGIEILFGHKSSIGSLVGIGVAIAIIATILWAFPKPSINNTEIISRAISQPLNGASRAEIEISSGVSELNLHALTSDSTNLISGTINLWQNENLKEDCNGENGQIRYSLKTEYGSWRPWNHRKNGFKRSWDLQINPTIPTDLDIRTGVGKTVLDLTGTTITELEINVGVGETHVILPSTGNIEAEIKGGVGKTVVVIPKGLAARIELSKGVGSVTVPDRFIRRDNQYESEGYEGAVNRVNLEVKAGVGEIEIREGE